MTTQFSDRPSYTNIQVLLHRKQDSSLLQRWINSYCWGKLSVFAFRMEQGTKMHWVESTNFLNIIECGIYSYQWTLRGYILCLVHSLSTQF